MRGLDKSVQFDLKLGFMELNCWLKTKEGFLLEPADNFSARLIERETAQDCASKHYSSFGLAPPLLEAHN